MSETRVVNVRSGEPYDIYCGRPGPWGNTYSHRRSDVAGVIMVDSAAEAVRKFRLRLEREVRCGKVTWQDLAELDGRALGCWCEEGEPCHVRDVLVPWARRAAEELKTWGT